MFTKLANTTYRSISNRFISIPCFKGRPSKAYQINSLMFKQNNVDSLRTTKKRVYTAHLLMTQCIYSTFKPPSSPMKLLKLIFFCNINITFILANVYKTSSYNLSFYQELIYIDSLLRRKAFKGLLDSFCNI